MGYPPPPGQVTLGHVIPRAVRLLRFSAGLSCCAREQKSPKTVCLMVLVDGNHHRDGYVTPIVCKHYNEQTGFWQEFLCQSLHPLHGFYRLIGQLSNHLHNKQWMLRNQYRDSHRQQVESIFMLIAQYNR